MTTSPKRVVVAVNPSAGVGRKGFIGPRTVDRLRAVGHEVVPVLELDFATLAASVRAALEHADALVVVGGDGMVNLGVSLVAGTDIPLGIVPSGTGNDMARGLGLERDDLDAAIESVVSALERRPVRIDAASIRCDGGSSWMANAVSAGFDALINERANRMRWPKGESRYVIALLRELVTFRPPTYELTVDGKTETVRAMLIAVANNRSIGGGMRITPDARIDDGLLDLFIVAPMSRLAFIRVFPKVFAGTHTDLPVVSIRRIRSIRIQSDTPLIAYADGERVGPLPMTIEVAPGAVRMLDQVPTTA